MNDHPSVSASTTNGPVIVSWSPGQDERQRGQPEDESRDRDTGERAHGRLSQGAAMNSRRLPHGSSA